MHFIKNLAIHILLTLIVFVQGCQAFPTDSSQQETQLNQLEDPIAVTIFTAPLEMSLHEHARWASIEQGRIISTWVRQKGTERYAFYEVDISSEHHPSNKSDSQEEIDSDTQMTTDSLRFHQERAIYPVRLTVGSGEQTEYLEDLRWFFPDKTPMDRMLFYYPAWMGQERNILFFVDAVSSHEFLIKSYDFEKQETTDWITSTSGLVSISPNGEFVATFDRDKLVVASIADMSKRYYFTGIEISTPIQPVWTEDSNCILFPERMLNRWVILDLKSEQVQELRLDENYLKIMFFGSSPDNKEVYFVGQPKLQDSDKLSSSRTVGTVKIASSTVESLYSFSSDTPLRGVYVYPDSNILPLYELVDFTNTMDVKHLIFLWDREHGTISKCVYEGGRHVEGEN